MPKKKFCEFGTEIYFANSVAWKVGLVHLLNMKKKHTTSAKTEFKLVEKKNHLACHGIFDSLRSVEIHLKETIPGYVAKGYFLDKTLTADSFEII